VAGACEQSSFSYRNSLAIADRVELQLVRLRGSPYSEAAGKTVVATQPTVLVLDDDSQVRESLQALLESRGYHIETFGTVEEFLQRAALHDAHCAVVDLRLPGTSAVEILKAARSRGCELPFIVITGYGDIPSAVRAMRAGAADYFTKPLETAQLVHRIEEVVQDQLRTHVSRLAQREVAERLESLTRREREVLDRVVEGKPTKQIAEELGISSKTVEVHRSHVTRKMHVRSVAELVRVVTKYQLETDSSDDG